MTDATTATATSSEALMGGDTQASTSASTAVAADTGSTSTTTAAATTTDSKPASDAKPAEDGKPAGAPESYADFKLPEGMTVDDSLLGDVKTVAKELNLPQEAAQKLVELAARKQADTTAQMQQAAEAQGEKWASEAKVDKEFGGDKFDESLAVAKSALDKFGTPELKSLLVQSKLGNHPEFIRLMYRAGKAISEDGFVPGRQGGQAAESLARRMYPNMNP